jgi:hypothetical protein
MHEMNDYVALHNALPPVNIVQTVLDMRDQRHGMVQTKVRAARPLTRVMH